MKTMSNPYTVRNRMQKVPVVHVQYYSMHMQSMNVFTQLGVVFIRRCCLTKLTTSFSTITRYSFFMTESVNMAVTEVHNQKLIKLGISQ